MTGPEIDARGTTPVLSVVVPIYDVEDYLLACLESIAAQTLQPLEVVLVDDGSTDRSGTIADEFATGREGWSVLHVTNGGLGRARNIGLDHSTAPYVAFIDSDDLVTPDAYEVMVHALRENGTEFVSGGVLRYDGSRTYSSGLHSRAIPVSRARTHVRRQVSLIHDTTAWNKVFRREFLVDNSLRFPEGVLYEDIPLTLPAHFLAEAVSMVENPVYLWRERQTAELSITQRRAELRNLEDRMAAVLSVDTFLRERQDAAGKALHDRKVLTADIPLYLDVVHEADDVFAERLVELVADYLDTVDPNLMADLAPRRRLAYELIRQRLPARLREAQELMAQPGATRQVVRRGLRLYAELPFRNDPDVDVPDDVYDVTRRQRLVTGVRDVYWDAGDLLVDGHAFIDRVPEPGGIASVRRFQLRPLDAAADERSRVSARRVRRPDVTGKATGAAINYNGSGFLARIGAEQLVPAADVDSVEYELIAQVATPAARRGWTVGGPEQSRAIHAPRAFVAPGVLCVPTFRARKLLLMVQRVPLVLCGLDVDGDGVTLALRESTPRPGWTWWVHARREDSIHGISVPVTLDGDEATARLSLDAVGVSTRSVTERRWPLWLVGAAAAVDERAVNELVTRLQDPHRPASTSTTGGYAAPLHLDEGFGWHRATARGRTILLDQPIGADGAMLVDTPSAPVVTDVRGGPSGLCLSGELGASVTDRIVLMAGSDQHDLPLVLDGERWTATIPSDGVPGSLALRWLRRGRWRLRLPRSGPSDPEIAVRADGAVEQRLGETWGEKVKVQLRSDRHHGLSLAVNTGGDWSNRGKYNQERARRTTYRIARRRPLKDTIFFEAWKGRQYSDSPRAIFEELRRQGDERDMVWAVEHHGVEVPDGVRTVVTHGHDYFRELGRSRWVVSNDSLPTHFVKRSGMRYGQTWHGTPLKRIGFDIENLQMANKNYLEQFAREVAKWDVLVSPNPFSTEILSRAFRYDGSILEIGYPRNDIFFRAEEREARAAAVRRRLRLADDRPVVLYAPTWRDDNYDRAGRYRFSMKLDLERLHRDLGDDIVLLIRGHQLVADSVDTSRFAGFARNVSHYPDISELYLVADVLITDYSSVMFDFVNTGRPMLFYTYDLESYRDELRGFYFDFEAEAPGPLLTHTREVIDALRDLPAVQARHAQRYERFRQRFAGMEDGRAAARFVDAFLRHR
jgi:CDP-glycerol glycerophosphotransferase